MKNSTISGKYDCAFKIRQTERQAFLLQSFQCNFFWLLHLFLISENQIDPRNRDADLYGTTEFVIHMSYLKQNLRRYDAIALRIILRTFS